MRDGNRREVALTRIHGDSFKRPIENHLLLCLQRHHRPPPGRAGLPHAVPRDAGRLRAARDHLRRAGNPADYRFLAVNPAFERMTGLKAEDTRRPDGSETLPGIEGQWIETYGKVALTGEPAFFESYSADLNKHFEVSAFRPAPNQFACIFADISDRKQAEESLRRSDKIQAEAEKLAATGRMAAQVADEINNPLAGIKNSFRLIRDAVPEDHPDRDMVERIEREIDRIAHIVPAHVFALSPAGGEESATSLVAQAIEMCSRCSNRCAGGAGWHWTPAASPWD